MTWVKRVNGYLDGLSEARFKRLAYAVTLVLYVFGVWLHYPNGGGHIYSDIVTVFQTRECPVPTVPAYVYAPPPSGCTLTIPYIQSFNEYPVLVAMFLYVNAVLGSMFAGSLVNNYYYFTAFFLVFPALLSVRELLKLIGMRGVPRNRMLWYFVVTPTFIYITLLNWYIIGVWLTLVGMRRYLQGSRAASGVLFGLSAAANFVTAVPALGLFIASKGVKERVVLAVASLGTYGAVNAPFVILNKAQWLASWHYIYAWNIEDSWMQAILPSLYSPQRHDIPVVVMAVVVAIMLWLRFDRKVADPMVYAFISLFGYAFATYIYTPQIDLAMLPFFVLLPVSSTYAEFLAFDITNSLIIIVGFSQALLPLGITYSNFHPINRASVVFWIEVVRSVWEGRFTFFNGVWSFRTPRAETGLASTALQAKEVEPV